jgi:hypothetical protein
MKTALATMLELNILLVQPFRHSNVYPCNSYVNRKNISLHFNSNALRRAWCLFLLSRGIAEKRNICSRLETSLACHRLGLVLIRGQPVWDSGAKSDTGTGISPSKSVSTISNISPMLHT